MGTAAKLNRRRSLSVNFFIVSFLLLCMASAAGFLKCGAPDCLETAASTGVLTRHLESCQKWLNFQRQQVADRRERAAAGSGSGPSHIAVAQAGGLSRKRKILGGKPPPGESSARRKQRMGNTGLPLVRIHAFPVAGDISE
jgi:hypothetical protein